jgi:hypothetical protein
MVDHAHPSRKQGPGSAHLVFQLSNREWKVPISTRDKEKNLKFKIEKIDTDLMSTTLPEGVPQPRPMSAEFALCAQFASAKGAFDKAPNQTQKLKLYSLFKYVTVGPCEESGIPR